MTPPEAVVIVAMDDESLPFLERSVDVSEPWKVGNARLQSMTLAGHPIVLVMSGIGLVNAAGATTTTLLSEGLVGSAPLVISAGTAGGVGEGVHVGEVVVGSSYINIDADARVFGYELGQVPGMPAAYFGDSKLLEAVPAAAALPDGTPFTVARGLMVSSYAFVDADRVPRIRSEFPAARSTDMETVAIAQTSHVFGVPFVSVRGISDLCGPSADDDHLRHVDDASDRSAIVVVELLDALAR
ncbi:5'-methylthioadenosine/S-adenosylhomocysteine nucleosidase [Frondihabitans cladoniiphilus]|uniref:adenosylhomocysteine nucleosidase n=1 Tax=Frondihabitans cladoniiphilus TaxID=715785 RepID=A0ABP8W083_9MICO